jgi:hypothetical protein
MADGVNGSPTPPVSPTVLTTAGLRRGGRWQQVFVPVKNEPGELLMIDKAVLRVDHDYQRRLDPSRIARYAANWSWVSCGTLIVSRREQGRFAIIDGQHRWEAAKLRHDIRDLPCLAFALDQIRDEAIGFLAANTERKIPSLADQFNALIVAQNPDAIVAERLAKTAGRRIAGGTGPWTISCTAELLRLIQRDRESVEACWPALIKMCEGQAMPARVLRGVVSLQRRMPKGHSFAEARFADRLVFVGWSAVTDEIKRVGHLEGNYSERSCAEGVLRAINKGLRQPLQLDLAQSSKVAPA